jgi:hypothetical protein
MQTLTPGSFLKLENQDTVEALKFTARRLAEHTATVVTENLKPSVLAGLASNLWEKAEYVARETERRRLNEIFTENFTERFRELKPEISLEDTLISEVLASTAATERGVSTTANAPAPEIGANGENETKMTESAICASPQTETKATEVEGKRDEFLGFVKTDEPFAATTDAVVGVPATTVSDEAERETIQAADVSIAETSKPEDESATAREQANSESEKVTAERENSEESARSEQSPPAATMKVSAGSDVQAGNANKTNASKTETKEPFEFGKCTISLNLVLLPSSAGGGNGRKAIVSASSHGSPPEIEFLEIADGENLTEIAELVRGKLAGFKNGLPAKYIEQLRESKTKTAKKSPTVRTPLAVPTKTAANQSKVEKTNSERKGEEASIVETAKPETSVLASSSAFVATVNRSVAANEIQGSLF